VLDPGSPRSLRRARSWRSAPSSCTSTPRRAASLASRSRRALADRHGARVTALFGVRPHASRAAYAYSAGAALRAVDEEGAPHEQERARLRELLAEREPECTWCEVAGDSVRHAFVAEAIYADLLVLGPPPASTTRARRRTASSSR
jgi:hypothetical protein